MKVQKKLLIVLDIDGVLNCRKSTWETNHTLDDDKVKMYLDIVKETGATVVLSSYWRYNKEACKFLNEHGIHWHFTTALEKRMSSVRGGEINGWFLENNADSYDRIAILDDDRSAFWAAIGRDNAEYFETTWDEGLTPKIAKQVMEYLND